MKVLTTDADGNLKASEAFPPMDAGFTLPAIINASTLAIGGADSSEIKDTRRMRLGMLLIKGVLAGTGTVDTTCVARLAIQIRTHLNGAADSNSTFPIYQYGASTLGAGAAATIDTVVQGHIQDGVTLTAISATPGTIATWSGEIAVRISAQRNAYGDAIAINGNTFYYPSGIALPLPSLFGRDIYSPYTSVRVRLMTFQKGAASLTTGTVIVTVSLVGTPL
jgi:hypothetical protein